MNPSLSPATEAGSRLAAVSHRRRTAWILLMLVLTFVSVTPTLTVERAAAFTTGDLALGLLGEGVASVESEGVLVARGELIMARYADATGTLEVRGAGASFIGGPAVGGVEGKARSVSTASVKPSPARKSVSAKMPCSVREAVFDARRESAARRDRRFESAPGHEWQSGS